MRGLRKTGGRFMAAAVMLCAAMPAQATMGCWNQSQVDAAKLRDLQSRLMVATLRCQALGMDITPAYNRFVVATRSTLQDANGVILAQFQTGFGPQGQTQYDRFATALANAYGGDATDPSVCAETEAVAQQAADANGDVRLLVALEDQLGVPPDLPGGRCEPSFGEAAPAPVFDRGNEAEPTVWNR
jgi:hypothetical protein